MGRFLFLGSGGSMGVPVIACDCEVCKSPSTLNKRLRPAGLVTVGGKNFLIDTGPDFRTQALTNNIKSLDGVLFTHAHNDHTAGIDELRVFYIIAKKLLPCLMSYETYKELKTRFAYLFAEELPKHQLVSRLHVQLLQELRGTTHFVGQKIQYMSYEQAGMQVNGYRFGDFAYISDIRHYPETIFEDLKGVKYLVLSSLKFAPSPLHFNIDESIEFANKVQAKQTWLTHISHELDHEKGNAYLPPHIRLAYDGLEITFDEEG